jgi:DNA-binding CsgD family transcriptional regulator
MPEHRFNENEVEALVALARQFGPSPSSARFASSPLLETCRQLLDSRCAILSATHRRKRGKDSGRVTVRVIRMMEGGGPRTMARAKQIIARAVEQRDNGGGFPSSDRVWASHGFDEGERSGMLIAGPVLLAEWDVETEGSQLILSVHRSPFSHEFGLRERQIMRLIRHACSRGQKFDANRLTPRLSQVLRYLEQGLSEKECASELQLSYHTVHVYVKTLYRMFNVSSRAELLCRPVNDFLDRSSIALCRVGNPHAAGDAKQSAHVFDAPAPIAAIG